MSAESPEALLRVRDLRVHFPTPDGLVRSVDGLSFDVRPGEILGVVGESGSGKSMAGKAILGLHEQARTTGEIWYGDQQLVGAADEELRRLRGAKIAMIFQDPLSSLHPYFTIGAQLSEAYRVHRRTGAKAARARAVEMLSRVGIPAAARAYGAYPHEFSGGMRQRAMIAMALICDPGLLIADEPTTALDVTVQAQILQLIRDLSEESGSAVVLITHDLGVVAETCDRVVVMYAGRCIEQAPVAGLFERPMTPYTWGLLGSIPRLDATLGRLEPITGQPPSLIDLPAGCSFAPRCGFASRVPDHRCTTELPEPLVAGAPDHLARCHLPVEDRQHIWHTQIAPAL
ncbi:ABC transporter ATP-binding protein [Kribbella kalugense]|uniref:Peptide/nickel transport system ATP-binding protein n=1 Tax=Kribbella kalugense TaxID=2512221 RepID=A0A4V3G8X8_9ACTN|nr:ABC transporter ATP-binding protein [Kribbella kalugense]TDW24634.1 peptide/nickel transport system ATP-binding protein [Kribbella kalugense]